MLKQWLHYENLIGHSLAGRRRNIMNAIEEELGGSGCIIRYQKMHRFLQDKGTVCLYGDIRVIV